METRIIYDYQGNTLGSITLPSNTSEEKWQEIISGFSNPPLEIRDIVKNKIKESKKFGEELIIDFATENVLLGYSTTQIELIIEKLIDVQTCLNNGSLRVCLKKIDEIQADELISQERLDFYKNKIQQFVDSM